MNIIRSVTLQSILFKPGSTELLTKCWFEIRIKSKDYLVHHFLVLQPYLVLGALAEYALDILPAYMTCCIWSR